MIKILYDDPYVYAKVDDKYVDLFCDHTEWEMFLKQELLAQSNLHILIFMSKVKLNEN